MTIRNLIATLAVAAATIAMIPAGAQTVNQRLRHQNQRVTSGVRHGRLTGNQVRKLRGRDASIHARERNDRIHNKGRLTTGERKRLQGSLNRTSKAIHRDKHDPASRGN